MLVQNDIKISFDSLSNNLNMLFTDNYFKNYIIKVIFSRMSSNHGFKNNMVMIITICRALVKAIHSRVHLQHSSGVNPPLLLLKALRCSSKACIWIIVSDPWKKGIFNFDIKKQLLQLIFQIYLCLFIYILQVVLR